MNGNSKVVCPRCQRSVSTHNHHYALHGLVAGSNEYCPMSKQHTPIEGLSATAYYSRALLVGNLAAQLRDESPEITWAYLETLPAWELQRIAMVALAGFDIEKTLNEAFSWLPDEPQQIRRSA